MIQPVSRFKLSALLWSLILLGLLASISTAAFVSWYLNRNNDQTSAWRSEQQVFDLKLEQLRRYSLESHALLLSLLSDQSLTTPSENPGLERQQQLIRQLQNQAQGPDLRNALTGFGYSFERMKRLWREISRWRTAFEPLHRDISEEISLGRVRSTIRRLQEQIGILEGRSNLRAALLIRRWKQSRGELFEQLSRQIQQEQGSPWPRAVRAVQHELNEVALLTELLASESNPAYLLDLRVNRLQPAIDRMVRNLSLMRTLAAEPPASLLPHPQPLLTELFGTDPKAVFSQADKFRSGLFRTREAWLRERQRQQQLISTVRRHAEQELVFISWLDKLSAAELNQTQQRTETELFDALNRLLTLVGVVLGLFLLLGWIISRAVGNQFRQLSRLTSENEMILNSAGEGVIGLDRQGDHTFINPAAATILGTVPEQLSGRSFRTLFDHDSGEALTAIDELLAGNRERISGQEARFLHAAGHSIPVEYSIMPISRDLGVEGAVLTFGDISASKKAELALKNSERQFRDLAEKSLVGIYIIQEGVFTYVNPRFAEIFHYSQQEIEGRMGPLDLTHPDDRKEVSANISRRMSGDADSINYRIRCQTRSGEEIHVELYGSRSVHNDQPAIIGTLLDITERTRSEARIQHQAYYDQLTGLPNRQLFSDRLQQSLRTAHRESTRIAVLFLDLDRFKNINDSLGHPVGDALLSSVAGRLNNAIRENDTVARLGGDEFTIILEHISSRTEPATVADKILSALSAPFGLAGHELFISVSIGICLYPDDGHNAEELVKHADAAMYQAKNQGRASYAFYTRELTASSVEWLELETDLRKAVRDQQLHLAYQPLISLNRSRVVGVEALLRWKHPQKGLISPARFIPLAEETSLILEIGEWVIMESCRQLQRWRQLGHSLPLVAINLSAIQLERGNIVATVRHALDSTGVTAASIELEITENSIIRNTEKTVATLNTLREMGISLSIDDFGTGYSSLNQLKELPINKLKIDQSFIADITRDPDDEAIVKAIINLARLLNLEVLAEGVETAEQQEFVRSNGCDFAQGYFYSPPLSADDCCHLFETGLDRRQA